MKWQDLGIILKTSKFRERHLLLTVLTQLRGKYSGLVRSGISRRNRSWLLPGSQVQLTWQARLDEHLGYFIVEPYASNLVALSANRLSLAAFIAARDFLLLALPERQAVPKLFLATSFLFSSLVNNDLLVWLSHLARWEFFLLRQIGYAPNLTQKADNAKKNSNQRNKEYLSGLVISSSDLPPLSESSFLRKRGSKASSLAEIEEALNFIGYFIRHKAQLTIKGRTDFLQILSTMADNKQK